jgi:hypothetical protein
VIDRIRHEQGRTVVSLRRRRGYEDHEDSRRRNDRNEGPPRPHTCLLLRKRLRNAEFERVLTDELDNDWRRDGAGLPGRKNIG